VSKSFKPLADQNYPPAQLAVGFCYDRGHGVHRDLDYARRYFRLTVEIGMVIENDWDHVRGIENAVQVLSLSDSSLRQSEKSSSHISLSLAAHEQLYFKRVNPLSALKFKEMKNPRIDVTERAARPIHLGGVQDVGVLGSGSLGVVRLIENEDGERHAVKYFSRTWDRTPELSLAAFSREFNACCKLNHPCIVPVCVSQLRQIKVKQHW
jgi:hypothetical protein